MFVKLPNSGTIFDTRLVRKIVKYCDTSWALSIDVGSVVEPSIHTVYIDNTDYDYLWEQLQKPDMLT